MSLERVVVKSDENVLRGHRGQFKEALMDLIWDNLNTKMNDHHVL